jgi:hypothetical protein
MSVLVEKWDTFELVLRGPETGNPFLDVTLTADFTRQDHTLRVHGFYDGEGVYKVRFMPGAEGTWTYITHSSAAELDNQRGALTCTPPSANNHGPVRVADTTHFTYADGSAYIPVGTTCYVWNLQGDELEERTLKTLETAPFNKMRMCVFPKRYLFNNNEPPSYPFPGQVTQAWDPALLNNYRASEPPKYWDFNRFNPRYFQHLEQRILDLRKLGIEADLILFHPYDFGAWGFDRMPADVNDRYLRYLVARLSSFRNVWWSFANEYDLMLDRTTADWDHYFQLVQELDSSNHLRSVHNCTAFYDHTQPWVTHCSVQHSALGQTGAWLKKYNKPVVVDECGYEGDIHMIWGDLSPEELMLRFWAGFTSGGYVGHGETYTNEQELLWWSKGGELIGAAPARIAFLRKVFEQGPRLSPVPKIDPALADAVTEAFKEPGAAAKVVPEGPWNIEAGGYHDSDYFLFYFGMHQPGLRNFNLPTGNYRVDVIDTWNMTIEPAFECASGQIGVKLPGRKFMAVRIQKVV